MTTTGKIVAFAAAGFMVGASLSVTTPVHAQGQRPPAYCASNDGRLARCQVPWRNAQLLQQKSNAPCQFGQTWGFDRGFIWVDKGCRGEFAEARGGWGGPPGGGYQPGRFRCESSGGSYQFCPANIGRGDVRLVGQLSGAPCTQGRTWGWRPDGIWVDRGCRADFTIYPRR